VGIVLAYPAGLAGGAQKLWERLLEQWSAARAADAATDDAPALVATGVQLSFGGVRALNGADVRVERGEIVGLIGPNGAGKTTFMNVVSGLARAESGSVRLFGREVADLPAEFRAAFGLSRSFQDAQLFPGLTVAETVQFAVARASRPGMLSALVGAPWARAADREAKRRAADILDELGLTPWADTLTSALSTGTRRICDLAAQVAAGPQLLLLDEPTAGVAQREAEAFGPLLRRVRDRLDCAVLLVEHDMPLLMGLCDRIYAMEEGRVIAEGTPQEIRNDPAVIASYLGTNDAAIARSGAGNGNGPGRGARRPSRAGGGRR
jgi:ABC-type branched-subunit amino acid transport system ATPase component